MKCEICKNEIQLTFLKKIIGSYIKDSKGKKHAICSSCQKISKKKEELLGKI